GWYPSGILIDQSPGGHGDQRRGRLFRASQRMGRRPEHPGNQRCLAVAAPRQSVDRVSPRLRRKRPSLHSSSSASVKRLALRGHEFRWLLAGMLFGGTLSMVAPPSSFADGIGLTPYRWVHPPKF